MAKSDMSPSDRDQIKLTPLSWVRHPVASRRELHGRWMLDNTRNFHLAIIDHMVSDNRFYVRTWDFDNWGFVPDEANPYESLEHAQAVAMAVVLLGE